jgi:hypothetical protein
LQEIVFIVSARPHKESSCFLCDQLSISTVVVFQLLIESFVKLNTPRASQPRARLCGALLNGPIYSAVIEAPVT